MMSLEESSSNLQLATEMSIHMYFSYMTDLIVMWPFLMNNVI